MHARAGPTSPTASCGSIRRSGSPTSSTISRRGSSCCSGGWPSAATRYASRRRAAAASACACSGPSSCTKSRPAHEPGIQFRARGARPERRHQLGPIALAKMRHQHRERRVEGFRGRARAQRRQQRHAVGVRNGGHDPAHAGRSQRRRDRRDDGLLERDQFRIGVRRPQHGVVVGFLGRHVHQIVGDERGEVAMERTGGGAASWRWTPRAAPAGRRPGARRPTGARRDRARCATSNRAAALRAPDGRIVLLFQMAAEEHEQFVHLHRDGRDVGGIIGVHPSDRGKCVAHAQAQAPRGCCGTGRDAVPVTRVGGAPRSTCD